MSQTACCRWILNSRQSLGWLVIAALCLSQTGCVQRRMTIRSNPPGAVVYIDNLEIGTTPVSTHFIYYGAREIRLVKDGFETLTVLEEFTPPPYQFFGVDFVTENLVPAEIRDERTLNYTLSPQVIVPTEELLGHAEDLRRHGRLQGLALPPQTQPVYAPPIRRLPAPGAPLERAL